MARVLRPGGHFLYADFRFRDDVPAWETAITAAPLRILQTQTAVQGEAVSASTRAFGLSKAQYEDGSVDYLNILDAERVVLGARLNEVRLRGEQCFPVRR